MTASFADLESHLVARITFFFHISSNVAPSIVSSFFPEVLQPSAVMLASIGAFLSTIAKQAPDADIVQLVARTFACSIALIP